MQGLAARVILLWGWRRALVAFLAGAMAVLVQAPYDFFAAGFVAFPVLVWLLDGVAASRPAGFWTGLMPAFATGWWFGFGYFVFGLWWIGTALLVEAESFAWALPLAVIGVPLVLAVFYGFAALLARLLWSDGIGRIASLAFAFGLAEWLRGFVLTGFPWNAIGYGVMPTPMSMQSVGVVGMVGMNAFAVFVFSMPGLLAARRHVALGLVLAAGLAGTHLVFGFSRLAAPPPSPEREIAVRIVQPSIDLSEKWDASVQDRIFETLMNLSAQPVGDASPPEVILWPETSVPFLFTDRPDALAAIGELLASDQVLLAGAVRGEEAGGAEEGFRYTNSVVAVDGSGEIVDAVDKIHLVPFGEYIPFSDLIGRLGLEQMVAGPMNFVAGTERHAIRLPGGLRTLPFICYEVIFPELVSPAAGVADFILNVTNDAWFGDTPGPYQHFRQAQVRAVETGLPLVRAANTGISAVVDGRGRIVDALAMQARGVIDVTLRFPESKPVSFLSPHVMGMGVVLLFFVAAFYASFQDRRRMP